MMINVNLVMFQVQIVAKQTDYNNLVFVGASLYKSYN